MTKPTRRLGRGLSSLISTDTIERPDLAAETQSESSPTMPPSALRGLPSTPRLAHIRVDQIRQNPLQPRRVFDETALASLAESIRQKGALQPVVVRPAESGYELIAGERRWRAAQLADIAEIPAIIRSARDDEMLELAIIENIHRADLNPVERARAYRQLQQRYQLSHEEIAHRVGEDRASVTNYIRLLALPDDLLQQLAAGVLSVGHAKVLLSVADPKTQHQLADQCVNAGWSVRRLEQEISGGVKASKQPATPQPARPAVTDMEQRLSTALGTRVQIKEGRRRHSGRILIEYYTLADFDRIIERLGIPRDQA